MKKFLPFATVVAFLMTGLGFTGAEFEGRVTYEISVDGGNLPPEAKAMFEGSELNIYVKGSKSRSDVQMGFQNTSTISDAKTNTSVMLMEMMGNKYKIIPDPKKEGKPTDISVKYLDETKEIAGYKCKKAEVTFKDQKGEAQSTTIWYTEEISNHFGHDSRSAQIKDIKGMLLQYEMNAERGMKMKMTAKTVSKESVPDSKFEIPSGYKETTLEDLQNEMMQMMGGQH